MREKIKRRGITAIVNARVEVWLILGFLITAVQSPGYLKQPIHEHL